MADIGKMKVAGAVALSDDGKSVANSNIMRLAMEYASGFGLKCLCHCEDKNLVDGGVVNEGVQLDFDGAERFAARRGGYYDCAGDCAFRES